MNRKISSDKMKKTKMLNVMLCVVMVATVFTVLIPMATSEPIAVDLSTWKAETYPGGSDQPIGVWTVSADKLSVLQSVNGNPTLFYSDFLAFDTKMQVKINVNAGDDDFIGFALGFDPGDTNNPSADYILVDWKRGTQYGSFVSPSCGPGTTAPRGLSVSHVTGIPTADELWGHTDQNVWCSPLGHGVTELARAMNLGSTGWVTGQDYLFEFEFTATSLKVYVNGVLEINITGSFNNGRLAFYALSQSGVTYSAFMFCNQANVTIKPETLNLKSKGKWVTAYIELPGGYDVSNIDVGTVMLNDHVSAEANPTKIGDYDDDGIIDLMVKFDRSAVQEILEVGDEIEITVTGELTDGTVFEGSDTIRVIDKGKGK